MGVIPDDLRYRLYFLAFFVGAWQFGSIYSAGLLPGPLGTSREIYSILVTGEFFSHMLATLRRVLVPFAAAGIVSVTIGLLMGVSERAEKFFDMGVIIGLTIPGLAWAVIAIMFFKLSELTAYTAVFIVVLPMITINFWEGVKDIDMDLVEMANVFDFGTARIVRRVILPQLYPYMFSATRFGLGVSWKVVVIVEFLAMGNGIGYVIGFEYNQFDMAGVLAWTGLFSALMITLEYGVLKNVEERYLGWRDEVWLGEREQRSMEA